MVFRHSKVLSFGAPEGFPYDFDRGAYTSSSLPSLFYLLLGLHGCSRFYYKLLCVTQYQELGALQLSIEMFRHILRVNELDILSRLLEINIYIYIDIRIYIYIHTGLR